MDAVWSNSFNLLWNLYGDSEEARMLLYILALLIGGIGTYASLHSIRNIRNTPRSKIRSAAQGYVELQGKVRAFASKALKAPVILEKCVWYEYEIEQYKARMTVEGPDYEWVSILHKTSKAPFFIQDETGVCLVDAEGAEVETKLSQTWRGDREGQRSFSGKFRHTVQMIKPGESLYVLGEFRTITTDSVAIDNEAILENLYRQGHLRKQLASIPEGAPTDKTDAIKTELATLQSAYNELESGSSQHQSGLHMIYEPKELTRSFIIGTGSELWVLRKKLGMLAIFLVFLGLGFWGLFH